MISQDAVDWHKQAAERDTTYLALGPVDDTETTDGPWSGGAAPSEPCGCCEINDFVPTDNPDEEPWCSNCDHSPEEHEGT